MCLTYNLQGTSWQITPSEEGHLGTHTHKLINTIQQITQFL
jgi:hypothetical protein